jgi:hypothetical protein
MVLMSPCTDFLASTRWLPHTVAGTHPSPHEGNHYSSPNVAIALHLHLPDIESTRGVISSCHVGHSCPNATTGVCRVRTTDNLTCAVAIAIAIAIAGTAGIKSWGKWRRDCNACHGWC